jgi:general stress protein YciG
MAAMRKAKNKVKAEAGRLGGTANYKNNGPTHMAKIGAEGAKTTHSRYTRVPYRQNDFAIVHRVTGKVVALLSGKPVPEFLKRPLDEIRRGR